MEERNDIVIYQSEDELVTMEALAAPANETIRVSQKAIASLFGCSKQNVFSGQGRTVPPTKMPWKPSSV